MYSLFFVVDNLVVIVSRIMMVFLHVISLLDIEKANDDLCDYGLDCDKDDVANKIVYDASSSSLVKVQLYPSQYDKILEELPNLEHDEDDFLHLYFKNLDQRILDM